MAYCPSLYSNIVYINQLEMPAAIGNYYLPVNNHTVQIETSTSVFTHDVFEDTEPSNLD